MIQTTYHKMEFAYTHVENNRTRVGQVASVLLEHIGLQKQNKENYLNFTVLFFRILINYTRKPGENRVRRCGVVKSLALRYCLLFVTLCHDAIAYTQWIPTRHPNTWKTSSGLLTVPGSQCISLMVLGPEWELKWFQRNGAIYIVSQRSWQQN